MQRICETDSLHFWVMMSRSDFGKKLLDVSDLCFNRCFARAAGGGAALDAILQIDGIVDALVKASVGLFVFLKSERFERFLFADAVGNERARDLVCFAEGNTE